ncbi:hypothetical protein ACVGW4_00925, partial [Enterobacter hormaechei]
VGPVSEAPPGKRGLSGLRAAPPPPPPPPRRKKKKKQKTVAFLLFFLLIALAFGIPYKKPPKQTLKYKKK